MGIVSLEGMEFFAKHGYYEEERKIGNKFTVDVYLQLDFTESADNDTLEGTVNYEEVYEIIRQSMTVDTKLLENLAGKMVKALKDAFPFVENVRLRISKHNPPIKGLCQRAYVELES